MPTIDIPDRICPHCGGTKWFMFNQQGYIKYHCHEKKKEYWRKWHKNNPGSHKFYRRKSGREKSKKLSDTYIKERLIYGTNLKFKDVTPEMILRFRNYAIAKRQLKNLENVKTQETKQAETDRGRSLSNGRESKNGIRQVEQSQLSQGSSVSLSLQHASNERSNALCSTREKIILKPIKTKNMSRKALFTDTQVQEMKESIRTGEPIAMLAERLATRYNVPTNTLRNKLYSVAKRTYKIAEWNGPKRRRQKNTEMSSVTTTTNVPTAMGKKVEMYADHIRIYF